MSFEAAFILTFFVIPFGFCFLSHFLNWVTVTRFWKHRRTISDSINDFLRNG